MAIHNVLYVKKLYPDTVYSLKKKYGVLVYQVIHPEVCQYITQCLRAVVFHAQKGQLKKVFLCFEQNETVVERFVFDLLLNRDNCESDQFLTELEASLRTFMLKLHATKDYLVNVTSPDSTFSIHLETSNYSTIEFNDDPSYEDFPWIEESHPDKLTTNSFSIIPLHGIETDILKLQIYAEK